MTAWNMWSPNWGQSSAVQKGVDQAATLGNAGNTFGVMNNTRVKNNQPVVMFLKVQILKEAKQSAQRQQLVYKSHIMRNYSDEYLNIQLVDCDDRLLM